MQITKIETIHLGDYPHILFVAVHTDDGLVGWADTYYMTDFPKETVDTWIAYGDVKTCAAYIKEFVDAGVQRFTLRLTGWDQKGQLRRVIDELMPHLLG